MIFIFLLYAFLSNFWLLFLALALGAGLITCALFADEYWAHEYVPQPQEFAEYHHNLCTVTKCDFSEEEARKLYKRFYQEKVKA